MKRRSMSCCSLIDFIKILFFALLGLLLARLYYFKMMIHFALNLESYFINRSNSELCKIFYNFNHCILGYSFKFNLLLSK
jgi:hypothetical protein